MSFFTTSSSTVETPATTPFSDSVEPDLDPLPDPFNLKRYIEAQDRNGLFDSVLKAIRDGHKTPRPPTDWMWCVFPQMDGCHTGRPHRRMPGRALWPAGQAVTSLDEARAILQHPLLGPRIRDAAQALLDTRHADLFCATGNVFDDVERIHSSMTLFRQAARLPVCIHDKKTKTGDNFVFRKVLNRHFVHHADSEDEDDEDDLEWGEPVAPTRKKRAARHGPTLRRLEELEMDMLEKRMASPATLCLCSNTKETLDILDRAFKERMQVKETKRYMKNSIRNKAARKLDADCDQAPEGWVTVNRSEEISRELLSRKRKKRIIRIKDNKIITNLW